MIGNIFNTILYQPLYNGLVFLIPVVPFQDVGLAVILLTIIVKFIIFPFTHKSVKAQRQMREIDPEIKAVKEKHSKDKQEQARKVMELYKKHGVNPFSGCLLLFIQAPIIIALYFVFWKGLTNGLDASSLYSFVSLPETISFNFLGFIDISGKSFLLAAFAGVTQYFQMKHSIPSFSSPDTDKKRDPNKPPSFKEEFGRSFRLQMKYGFPILVFFISYTISAAVALYWTTSNLFSITHELIVRKKAEKIMAEKNNLGEQVKKLDTKHGK